MTPTPPVKAPKRPVDTRVEVAERNLKRAQEAAQATTATAQGKKPEAPILTADRLKGAEFDRIVHTANPPAGHTLEHMLSPAYWAHVAPKLRPWDKVEIRAEDGTYFAEFLVLACDRTWAKMHVLRWDDLTTQDVSLSAAQPAASAYEVKHNPTLHWHVVRKADRQLMHRDAQTAEDAQTWLREHLKVVPA